MLYYKRLEEGTFELPGYGLAGGWVSLGYTQNPFAISQSVSL